MEITVDLVDWTAVKDKADKGTLQDELLDIEGGEDWVTASKKWTNESFSTYCNFGVTFETAIPNLNGQDKTACENSLFHLLNETADMPKEMGDALDPEYYVGAISPETITKILSTYSEISIDNLEASLTTDVMEYIKEWIQVLEEAASLKRDLIIQVG